MNQLLDPEGWTQSSWPTYSIEIELAQESPYPLTSFSSFMHAKTCKEQGKVGGKNCRRQRKKKKSIPPFLGLNLWWMKCCDAPSGKANIKQKYGTLMPPKGRGSDVRSHTTPTLTHWNRKGLAGFLFRGNEYELRSLNSDPPYTSGLHLQQRMLHEASSLS